MNLRTISTLCTGAVAALFVFAVSLPANATNNCDMCSKISVPVKSGTAITCTGLAAQCDCNTYAQAHGYAFGSCQQPSYCLNSLHGSVLASCSVQYCCGASSPGVMKEDQTDEDSVTTGISDAMDGNVQTQTTSYWGYYNSVLKTQSTGVSSNCEAKIHVCFVHGFSDLTGVTDQNSCNNACNSATNTNQDECYDTDCSSRCGGWWTGSGSCS